VAATTPEPSAEIGWVELDDISQIDELANVPLTGDDEEREYTFEEADEATLAELGLLDAAPSSLAPEVVQPAEAVAAPARRRTRTPKATADASVDEAPAKPARRSRVRKADATAAPTDAPAADEKPKARRTRATTAKPKAATKEPAAKPARRRTAKAADTETPADESAGEETQGIWKRFRTARGGGSSS
jgi:hypothetical protein